MLVAVFILISAAAAVLFTINTNGASLPIAVWQPVLVFLIAFAAVNILFLAAVYGISRLYKSAKNVPIEKQSRLCRNLCWLISGMVCFYAGARAHVTGTEKLPKKTHFLLISNHLSGFDPLVIFSRLRKYNIAFISKPSNIAKPILGEVGCAAGCLAIDRENNREAVKTINMAADYIKRGVCSMAIYPEGSRSKTGLMSPFHPGSFKIAKKADCPVVIACSKNTDLVKKNFGRGGTDVYLDILETVPVEKVRELNTQQLADYAYNLIRRYQQSP